MIRVIKQKLSEIALISAGKNAPKDESFNLYEGLPFIRASHLNNLVSDSSFIGKIPRVNDEIAQSLKLNIVKKNSILFAKSGMSATMNRIVKIINDAYFVNHLACITPREDILDSDFLKYFLYFFNPSNLIQGEAYPSINLSVIADLEIPLPSLATQKAIAEKLDKADALRKKDQELLAQYDELAQSIFIDMFGDPVKNEMGWEKVIVDKITLPIKNLGKITEPDYIEYVDISSVDNIRKKIVSTTSYKIDERPSRAQQILKAGDVLLSTVRPNLKNIAVNNCDGYIGSTGFYVFRCKNELIDENFLFEFINSDSVTSKFEGMVSGANYPALKSSDIRNFNVIIPPITLQASFAEKIKNIEAQKALVKRQAEQSEDLFQALLQESFSF